MKSIKRVILSHGRRLSLELLNVLLNHDFLFRLIGILNKRFKFIESIFLVYPATKKYALAYVYPSRLPKVKWNVWPCGLLRQNQKFVLMFCISATNDDFTDPRNVKHLKEVESQMEELRNLLGAKSKTFAGTLPGILSRKKILLKSPEAELTAIAVCKAIDLVKKEEVLNVDAPIIVLGGKGFIGSRVIKILGNKNVYSVDSLDKGKNNGWPEHLKGQQVIVINITLTHVLKNYVHLMWPGTMVINEVYPEPDKGTLDQLRAKDCDCYHVVGIAARAFPPFPAAYKGAIPCCAAWHSPNMEVVVKKIN